RRLSALPGVSTADSFGMREVSVGLRDADGSGATPPLKGGCGVTAGCIDTFRGAAEAPAPQAQHFLLECLDPAVLLQEQLFQLLRIIRQLRVVERHACECTQVRARV